MRRALVFIVAAVALVVAARGPLMAAEEIEITVSPNVINIASNAELVTVHTDLPIGDVVGATVTLDGVAIAWWKADNRGNFVAKFKAADVKDVVEPDTIATLTLSGMTTSGTAFTGTDDVKIVEVEGRRSTEFFIKAGRAGTACLVVELARLPANLR
jgi:hypothetical protein